MSSNDPRTNDQTSRDDIAPPDPTAGQAGDGPTQTGAANPGATAGEEGEGADKSTQR
ncbi:MAG TPA: hypothetical protein VF588_07535 [Pyrinomonadaceae bacterium]|jgi:hypothetical protein